ncbi:hypothetical protein VPH35_110402 [Triticum aestivum]
MAATPPSASRSPTPPASRHPFPLAPRAAWIASPPDAHVTVLRHGHAPPGDVRHQRQDPHLIPHVARPSPPASLPHTATARPTREGHQSPIAPVAAQKSRCSSGTSAAAGRTALHP